MQSKWLDEIEKKSVKEKRNIIFKFIYALAIILIIMGIFLIRISSTSNSENRSTEIRSILINTIPIIIISTLTYFLVIRKNFNKQKHDELRHVLLNTLTTQEEYTLLDNEIYGTLKREVTIGESHFTFTPHFLIEIYTKTSYLVIKLQNINYIKIRKLKQTSIIEFFNKTNDSIGSIKISTAYENTFVQICREQIPWAKFTVS